MAWKTITKAALAVALIGGVAAAPAQAQTSLTTDQSQALLARLQAIPAAGLAHAKALKDQLGLDDDVINPADYQCTSSTPVRDWLAASEQKWTPLDRAIATSVNNLQPVLLDTVLFPKEAGTQFGQRGEYTTQITHTFRDLGKFWDIQSSQIVIAPMHGSVLTDRPRLTRVFQVGFGFDQVFAASLADAVATLMDQDQFDHGNHPFFTFNAFALGGLDIPGFGTIPPEIVMGDGVLAGFTAVGLDDVAGKAILAHEFGHQVQFQKGLTQTTLTGPEASRRLELMADAFGSYYLTHARGATLRWKRVQEFLQIFYQLGDCQFAAASHHGTPLQRLHAAEWGSAVAADTQKQGHILPSLTFAAMFEQKLPELVAPDAP
ncbi:hypothetical protein [Actinocrispum sp. NPDC049592]|uniref:hypothetical protein n=1 Tax=Actinocrispum sp. NPDC049592 TaxID=3154835 RepID=UPI0034401F64